MRYTVTALGAEVGTYGNGVDAIRAAKRLAGRLDRPCMVTRDDGARLATILPLLQGTAMLLNAASLYTPSFMPRGLRLAIANAERTAARKCRAA